MGRLANSRKTAKSHDISKALKELDRQICESFPQKFNPPTVPTLYEVQAKRIADALDAMGKDKIESVVDAAFHDVSYSPAHREAARRWFAQNGQEAKKVRYVFDRFDGLARLNRLKEAMERPEPQATPQNTPQQKAQTAPPATPSVAPPDAPAETNPGVPLQLGQAGLQLLFARPNIHGEFASGIAEQVQRMRQDRHYIFLAFPPKCGGTFIRSVVGRASGAGPDPARPGHALGGRDVSPYLPSLAAQMLSVTGPKAFMTHAHMIAYHSNIQLLNLFQIKPVVMKRSIPDMLRSFADMADTEGKEANGGHNWSLLCGVHTTEKFSELDADARADFLVYHQAPWYIQFYASWLHADRNKALPVHWVTYEGFLADQAGTICGILDFYGLADKSKHVPDLIARAQSNRATLRFNKGISGRGEAWLKPEHLRHLHRLAAGYSDIDFVAEGLLPRAL